MTLFWRPEALATLRRWGETLGALALTALGVWWALQGPGPVYWLGWLLALVGAGLTLGAVQRARFTARGDAAGVIEVIEGEIRYFGPRGGGVIALDLMQTLMLSADGAFWLVESLDGTILAIPRAAKGNEALFDAFAALDGLDMPLLLRTIAQGPAPRARAIWQRRSQRLLT